jgi:hypothetical protein
VDDNFSPNVLEKVMTRMGGTVRALLRFNILQNIGEFN